MRLLVFVFALYELGFFFLLILSLAGPASPRSRLRVRIVPWTCSTFSRRYKSISRSGPIGLTRWALPATLFVLVITVRMHPDLASVSGTADTLGEEFQADGAFEEVVSVCRFQVSLELKKTASAEREAAFPIVERVKLDTGLRLRWDTEFQDGERYVPALEEPAARDKAGEDGLGG